jgi:hypothetical protein
MISKMLGRPPFRVLNSNLGYQFPKREKVLFLKCRREFLWKGLLIPMYFSDEAGIIKYIKNG